MFHLYCVIPMHVCTIIYVCSMSVLSDALEALRDKIFVCVNILGNKALSNKKLAQKKRLYGSHPAHKQPLVLLGQSTFA